MLDVVTGDMHAMVGGFNVTKIVIFRVQVKCGTTEILLIAMELLL